MKSKISLSLSIIDKGSQTSVQKIVAEFQKKKKNLFNSNFKTFVLQPNK